MVGLAKRYAVMNGDRVKNVALATSALGEDWVRTDDAQPGWVYKDGVFAPVEADPAEALAAELTKQRAARQVTYTAETDPLFFKWQAGEATEAEWLAKREEIRTRFPYPEEV